MRSSFTAALLSASMCALLGVAGVSADDQHADLSILTSDGTPFADGESIICLGDSITAFGGSPTGYVTLLHDAFAKAGHPAVEVINAGISGNSVPDLQGRLDRGVVSRDPTVVFIYIGINDVWHHNGDLGGPKTAYEAGLREIIGKLKQQGCMVVLATPSVIGEKADGSNALDASLDVFANSARVIAQETGVGLCDLRKAFIAYLKEHNSAGREKGVLTVDGVHMIAAGDRLIAQEAARSLVAAMRRGVLVPRITGGDFYGSTDIAIHFLPAAESRGLIARYTLDGTTPTAGSPEFLAPITVTKTTMVTVRAFRAGMVIGDVVTRVCTKLIPLPADVVHDPVPGLHYAYYELSFGMLPDFSHRTVTSTGTTPIPAIAMRKRDVNYALRFTGYIKAPTDGLYTFGLSSDDGSRLSIGGRRVIDNDGQHGMGLVEGRIKLIAGMHACVIEYFQGGGDQGLELFWSADGTPVKQIPETAFFSDPVAK